MKKTPLYGKKEETTVRTKNRILFEKPWKIKGFTAGSY